MRLLDLVYLLDILKTTMIQMSEKNNLDSIIINMEKDYIHDNDREHLQSNPR